ncbi:MAG: class I SAM-dependent methyltransferase [Bdellovibrionales bacterium]|nr:class I SAM-dependent methyltransferase [Bdellovibrionales bacterium]
MLKSSVFLENFTLPEGWSLKLDSKKAYKIQTSEGLNFSIDFPSKKKLISKQALVKAIGFKNQSLSVLDITAGWAKDSFLISQLGCKVRAIESHPFVFHFVKSQLELEFKGSFPFELILGDSLNYLKSLKEDSYPDVIFIDPMFQGRKKSLSQKSLRILKEFVGETQNKQTLFNHALLKAQKRVVVKRHKLDKPLSQNFISSFKGHSICYDVFQAKI